MDVLRTVAETQARCLAWRERGLRVGLVPTMGYLHEGHLSLVRIARERADRVVATIFVNPTQFGPAEDLARYPRDEEGDLAKLRAVGASLVFLPSQDEMYPSGYQTRVELTALPRHLCGRSRPTHFQGVTTVVTKLFGICQPHVAVFGQKDYQQLLVLRRMTADLNLPIDIIGGPIVREPDGLAMSSRNAYLTAEARSHATVLHDSLRWAAACVREGERDARSVRAAIEARIVAAGGRVDYVAIVDEETLEDVDELSGPARGAIAVFFGQTRLIDNMALAP